MSSNRAATGDDEMTIDIKAAREACAAATPGLWRAELDMSTSGEDS